MSCGSEPAAGVRAAGTFASGWGSGKCREITRDIRVVANIEFLSENPAAAELFELVEIPLADIAAQNELLAGGENSDEEIRRHAQEWIEANRDIVDPWLEAARLAADLQ